MNKVRMKKFRGRNKILGNLWKTKIKTQTFLVATLFLRQH